MNRYLLLVLGLLVLAIILLVRNAAPDGPGQADTPAAKRQSGPGTSRPGQAPDRASGPTSKSRDRLEDGHTAPPIHTTPSGLQYQVLVAGSGPPAGEAVIVSVHYHATLDDGTVFDTTGKFANAPINLPPDGLIKGWQEGLQLMREGSKYRFIIPPDLAYGEKGLPPTVPPNATLTFEVELASFLRERPIQPVPVPVDFGQ